MKDNIWTWMEEWESRLWLHTTEWLTIVSWLKQILPNTKIQMQLNWLHVKMLDQSMKSKESGYKCNGSVPYDTCMYEAVIKVTSVLCDLSWQYYWLPRLWEERQCRAALFPGFQGITRSAQIRLISTLLTGNIITGLLTNRQDHNLVTQLYSSLLQVDCPNPCAFLSVSAGGQNREEFHSNQSQVWHVQCTCTGV